MSKTNKSNILVMATMLLLLVLPISASGEVTFPYIKIKYPYDGQVVEGETRLEVVAEGYELEDPYVTITGENMGTSFPLQGCVYSIPERPLEEVNENGSVIPVRPRPMKMYCNTNIDLSAFQNQKVKLTTSVYEQGRKITDSVGLFVSGQCA